MGIQSFLSRLKIYHMVSLIKRFGLNVDYNNPSHRHDRMTRALKKYWQKNPPEECTICLESVDFSKAVATPCGHIFCDTCLIPHIRRKESCPNCREHCSYTSILSQLSSYRLIKLHPICTSPLTPSTYESPSETNIIPIILSFEEPEPQPPYINPFHLFIATIFLFLAFFINLFIIYMCIITVVRNFITVLGFIIII